MIVCFQQTIIAIYVPSFYLHLVFGRCSYSAAFALQAHVPNYYITLASYWFSLLLKIQCLTDCFMGMVLQNWTDHLNYLNKDDSPMSQLGISSGLYFSNEMFCLNSLKFTNCQYLC